jgi:hypothetical protein
MKNIIFIATFLICLFSYDIVNAQIETENNFNVENTLWLIDGTDREMIGFCDNSIYAYNKDSDIAIAFSVSFYRPNALITRFTGSELLLISVKIEGLLISLIGKGMATVSMPGEDSQKITLTKISDNFTVEPAINK